MEVEETIKTTDDFKSIFGYSKTISKILIANNGIAAVKCIRSIRQWCYDVYENDRIVHFVAMVTPEDLNANAEYVQLADEFLQVPTGPSALNYGNVDLIVKTAQNCSADAVWAGWGHASENPLLPKHLAEIKIIFLGPSSKSMWLLGDKIASTIIAQTLNIPTIPWSGSGVFVKNYSSDIIDNLPDELYKKCQITSILQINKLSSKIGFPFMLKASEGGGGKGIRKVTCHSEIEKAYKQIQKEVANSPIFMCKLIENARHIEIQLIGDYYGDVISLHSRDCTIQRRHQKIIEEAPAIICSPEILKSMQNDAIIIAKSVKYFSAGTVEYLFDKSNNLYYFLELNPRLQVEHPCTEIIANVNLPACQLQISIGKRLRDLDQLKHIFLEDSKNINPEKITPFPVGHVIAARITAENPEEGFRPYSGSLRKLNFRSSKNIFGYFSVHSEGSLHKHADSQFGHLFSWGETRNDARKGMIMALKELAIHGEIRTTINFLIGVLEHPIFIKNNTTTCWLDNIKDHKNFFKKPSLRVIIACGATCIAVEVFSRITADADISIRRKHSPAPFLFHEPIKIEFIYDSYKYSLLASKSSQNSYFLTINNSVLCVEAYNLGKNGLLVNFEKKTYSCFLTDQITCYCIDIGSTTCLLYKDIDPSIIRSPSSGKLISYLVPDGSHVLKGTDYAEIEVMKMIMSLPVPESGIIKFNKEIGATIEAGTIIANLELDDPMKACSHTIFTKSLDPSSLNHHHSASNISVLSNSSSTSPGDDHSLKNIKIQANNFTDAYTNILNILDGYCVHEPYFVSYLEDNFNILNSCMSKSTFLVDRLRETLVKLKSVLPIHLYSSIDQLISEYSENLTSIFNQLPITKITSLIQDHAVSLKSCSERESFYSSLTDMLNLLDNQRKGIRSYKISIFLEFLKRYLDVELLFPDSSFDCWISQVLSPTSTIGSTLGISSLEDENSRKKILSLVISHSSINSKNLLVLKIIDTLHDFLKYSSVADEDVKNYMHQLSNLPLNDHLKVTLKAKQFLISSFKPPFEVRHNQLESIFLSIISDENAISSIKSLKDVINSDGDIFDILPSFFFSSNSRIQSIALEAYIRRSYNFYDIYRIKHDNLNHIQTIQYFYKPSLTGSSIFHSKDDIRENNQIKIQLVKESSWKNGVKRGLMACFESFEEFEAHFSSLLSHFNYGDSDLCRNDTYELNSIESQEIEANKAKKKCRNVFTLCIKLANIEEFLEDDLSITCHKIVHNNEDLLNSNFISRITFMISDCCGYQPFYFTFRSRFKYQEDKLFRNIDPSIGYLLEMKKMANFDIEYISCENPSLKVYYGVNKKTPENPFITDRRYFIRTIIRNIQLISVEASFEYVVKASEIKLLEALDQLDVMMAKANKPGHYNHIFFNFVPCILIDPHKTLKCIREIIIRHSERLIKHKIMHAEMKMVVYLEQNEEPTALRLIISNNSGYSLNMNLYKELFDSNSGTFILKNYLGDIDCSNAGISVYAPYPPQDPIQFKRLLARDQNTIYVYDFPDLFTQAIYTLWKQYESLNKSETSPDEANFCSFKELILSPLDNEILIESNRPPGINRVGIVCWSCTFFLPHNVGQIQALVVANDCTFQNGSFTESESKVFCAACKIARSNKIPLIYICSSSGARIGLAKEVKDIFKVEWKSNDDYSKGIDYLYVDECEYIKLSANNSIRGEKILHGDEIRYKITDIVGEEEGIGVENLRGSGAAAGEMSRCFQDTFTISLVTGKAVGIGAYLVRLGRRVIQVNNSTIILTGFEALNRVLGKKVYSSHHQLGGTNIMYHNGVSHLVAKNEFDGVLNIIKWLSYSRNLSSNNMNIKSDPYDNLGFEIGSFDQLGPDPRCLLGGKKNMENKFIPGFFDNKSCFEIATGWAQSLIVGRARLGGMPVAYIANEIVPTRSTIPCDPADPTDLTKDVLSIGQVLSPESSFKFSQAIDESKNEHLPIFIFANLRGFSAGLKDMFNQVIKYGAMIVDSLRSYNQPVFIYILPNGEIRGGAWAVLDTSINPHFIEMYSSDDSRANILEPVGAVSIKYRQNDILKTISRLEKNKISNKNSNQKVEQSQDLSNKHILDAFYGVALKFAELHDTPYRMYQKGVIKKIISWQNTRRFFFWRLRRRLYEEKLFSKFLEIDPSFTINDFSLILKDWSVKCDLSPHLLEDDEFFVDWIEKHIISENSTIYSDSIIHLTKANYLKNLTQTISKHPEFINPILEYLTALKIDHQNPK